jgi:hypothetical protein
VGSQLQSKSRALKVIGTREKHDSPAPGGRETSDWKSSGSAGQSNALGPSQASPSLLAAATQPPGSSLVDSCETQNHAYPDPATGPSRTYSLVPAGRRGSSLTESVTRGFERTLTSPTSVSTTSPGLMLVGGGLRYARSVGLGIGVAGLSRLALKHRATPRASLGSRCPAEWPLRMGNRARCSAGLHQDLVPGWIRWSLRPWSRP